MKRTFKLAAMLFAVLAVFATGCRKDNPNYEFIGEYHVSDIKFNLRLNTSSGTIDLPTVTLKEVSLDLKRLGKEKVTGTFKFGSARGNSYSVKGECSGDIVVFDEFTINLDNIFTNDGEVNFDLTLDCVGTLNGNGLKLNVSYSGSGSITENGATNSGDLEEGVVNVSLTKQGNNNDSNEGGNSSGIVDDPAIYRVLFRANGGSGGYDGFIEQYFIEDETKALEANIFTYEYHTFVNWNTMVDGSGDTYTDGQEVTMTHDIILYAQWQQITYTLTFDANGGTGEMAPQIFNAGEGRNIAVNAFLRENYWFLGWNSSPDGTGTSYSDKQFLTLTENDTLYAQWSLGVTGNIAGHNYVDLGLPSGPLWATCNVGANFPWEYGDYFAWGEIQPQADNTYDWDSYKYANGAPNKLTKYSDRGNTDTGYNIDGRTCLEPEDDAAIANWGGGWRMPTGNELGRIFSDYSNCTSTRTTQNGVVGCLIIGPNGNSLFLPYAGKLWQSGLSGEGQSGYYWSSWRYENDAAQARSIMAVEPRFQGFSVRPVIVN